MLGYCYSHFVLCCCCCCCYQTERVVCMYMYVFSPQYTAELHLIIRKTLCHKFQNRHCRNEKRCYCSVPIFWCMTLCVWVIGSRPVEKRSSFVLNCRGSEKNSLPSFETSDTDYRATRRHIPEELNSQLRRCENLKTGENY